MRVKFIKMKNRGEIEGAPKCSVCGESSTGIHFGVEACAACSAFFRRTVVHSKKYICGNENNCELQKKFTIGQLCRACRLERCLQMGMDKDAVQFRRDAIGHYSQKYAAIKRNRQNSSPSTKASSSHSSRPSSNGVGAKNILGEIFAAYQIYEKRRKVFYCNSSLLSLFDDSKELEATEITDFRECIFQILRVEPRLCIEFIDSLKSLNKLPCVEKASIYSNFILKLQAIEEPYLTWKFGGLENGGKFWMMQNRTYIAFDRADHYFSSDIMQGLNLDEKSAKNLFIPSFKHGLEMVGQKMAALNIDHKEMVAIIGIVLFDPNVPNLSDSTKLSLNSLRNRLFANLLEFQSKRIFALEGDSPEVRFGNLILSLIGGIRIHSQRTRQNMQMLEIFDVVPRRDKLFPQMTGIREPSKE